jgi:tRNA 5-methylaminomethyl-2-thiouridine biosynthesis bifunctional protein
VGYYPDTGLKIPVCYEGYAIPMTSYTLSGATYSKNQDLTFLPEDNKKIWSWFTHRIKTDVQVNDFSQGKTGFRTASRDRLPLVGPVPDHHGFENLKYDFRHLPVHPHLYASLGHGSRGMVFAPIAAEILASIIFDQTLPVEKEVYRALHPCRFAFRDLRKKISWTAAKMREAEEKLIFRS